MLVMLSPHHHGSRNMAHLRKHSVQMLLIGLCLGVTFGIVFIPIFDCDTIPVVISQQETVLQVVEPEASNQLLQMNYGIPVPQQAQDGSNNAVSLDETGNAKPVVPNPVPVINQTEPVFHRPRYMSTELGVRKKLIVGIVLSDASSIEGLLRLNQTLTHYVDKVIMFINGTEPGLVSQLKSYDLPGVIAMPMSRGIVELLKDTSEEVRRRIVYNYVALKGIKYFGDTFRDNYDYFFISADKYYIHGKRLIDSLRKISVTEEILWGIPGNGDNSSCNLDSGFVMSRSLVTLLGSRVIRCLSSAALLQKLSGSVAKCIAYLSPESACRSIAQGQEYSTVETTADPGAIIKAITVGPVSSPNQILKMHEIICKNRQREIKKEIVGLEEKIKWLVPKAPEEWRKLTWPIGLPSPSVPKTRFDVNKWIYFTSTTMYLKSEYEAASLLRGIDGLDIENILESSRKFIKAELDSSHQNGNDSIELLHGYRRFDPIRGMEYILDFQDQASMQMYRIEGLRPLLGKIEIISVPFVTEAKRLTIIVPITLQNVNQAKFFLDHWYDTTTDRKSNTVVILALVVLPITDADQPNLSLHPEDIENIKQLVNQYKVKSPSPSAPNNSTKKPVKGVEIPKVGYAVVNLNSLQSTYQAFHIKLGILDHLGKRSIGPSTLVLMLEPSVNIKEDFLNRVRLTTILNTQVFSPIPFVEYIPSVAYYKKEYSPPKELGINKHNGYFNSEETRVISFYYGDYLNARKSLSEAIPSTIESLLNLFIQGSSLHIFRATEPAFHIRFPQSGSLYDAATCERNISHCSEAWWGSKAHLAKIVMSSGIS